MPEWHDHKTMFSECRKFISTPLSPVVWTKGYLLSAKSNEQRSRAQAEMFWLKLHRPFYQVWPSVAQAFCEVTLEVPRAAVYEKLISTPEALVIRFAVGGEPTAGGKKLRSILAARMINTNSQPGLGIWVDTGEKTDEGLLILDFMNIALMPDAGSVLESVECLDWSDPYKIDQGVLYGALKCVVCLALVKDDPEYVRRVVLKSDEDKPLTPAIVERAAKKDVNGFHVGKDIEVGPHYRRPHFAIRWTGKGRKNAKLTPISGCVVRGKGITEVPTGYEG